MALGARAGPDRRARRPGARLPDPDPGLARDRQRQTRRPADRRHLLPALQLLARVRPPGRPSHPDLRHDRQSAPFRRGPVGPPDRVLVAAAVGRGRGRKAHRDEAEGVAVADAQLGRLQAHPPRRRRALTRHRRRARLRRNPYTFYDQPDSQPYLFDGEPDDRLPPKERVVAIFAEEETVVVPFSRLKREPVVQTEAGGRPVVVFYKRDVASPLDGPVIDDSRDVGTAAAFDSRVDGRRLSFERRGGGFVDRETGSRWDIAGRAGGGELTGPRPQPGPPDGQFLVALAAFVPDARIES